jgi:hypothetical protein
VKRCPTCNKTFTDRNLSFCIDDGTPLIEADSPDEITKVSPRDEGWPAATEPPRLPGYQPPGGYVPPGSSSERKRKAWPWVLGIFGLLLLLLVGMGIAAAIFVPKLISEAVNNNTSNSNTNNRNERGNSNWNSSNSNVNTNDNTSSDDESEAAPTDEKLVLSQLTDLEHEWTAANINADKRKLSRILADDYAGTDANGKPQGKADYLRTVERDTSIQKWDFEDLKVDLNGDRAALSGIIRLQIEDKPVSFTFTDKFVWRDGRWQAIGSEVAPVK